MKKFIKRAAIIFISLIVCFSAAACTFIDTDESGNSNNANNGGGSTEQNPTTSTEVYVADKSTYEAASAETLVYRKVVFNKNTEANYSAMDLTETARLNAIEKVRRSSVAITVDGGAGSGVVVDMNVLNEDNSVADGKDVIYVLTCHHMISSGGEIYVYFPDSEYSYDNENYIFSGVIGGKISDNANYAVTLVGGDLNSDIALIKVDISKAAESKAVLTDDEKTAIRNSKVKIAGDGYSVTAGEPIFSIGNPTGSLPGTVSCGTVSYEERKGISVSDIGNMCLLQMDVTSNPGNSGGGLYNLYGDLIGITNAGNTSYQNINFAIPAKLPSDEEGAKTDITNHGFVYCATKLLSTASDSNYGCVPDSKMKFGFTVSQTNASNGTYQLVITAVTEGGLAESAGLKVNDVIKTVKKGDNVVNVTKVSEFTEIVSGLSIGESIEITVSRLYTSQYGYGSRTETKTFTLTCYRYWFYYQSK